MQRLLGLAAGLFLLSACPGPSAEEFDAAGPGDAGAVDSAALDAGAQDSAPSDLGGGADAGATSDAARADQGGVDHALADAGGVDSAHDSGTSVVDSGPLTGTELNPGWIGGACSGAGDCNASGYSSTAICETGGFENGLCTQACTLSSSSGNWICPDQDTASGTLYTTTRCIDDDSGAPRCVTECDFAKSDTGCRPGYTCVLRQRHLQPSSIFPVCLPSDGQRWPGEPAPGEDIGAACDGPGDCAHLSCLPLSGGYCSKTMCDVAGCPAGSRCWGLASPPGTTACLQDCSNATECRQSDGYTCDDDGTCWPEPVSGCALPAGSGFNQYVVESINDTMLWPKDGTYPFCLLGSCNSSTGMIHNLNYGGQQLFAGGGDCFCTGHTLEVLADAWRRYREAQSLSSSALYGDLTVSEFNRGPFYQQWQGTPSAPQPNLASAAEAFELVGIGVALSSSEWNQAQTGDFINISRDPPSGHSAIFINWIRDSNSQIIGLRYYGCNPGGGDSCPDPNDAANQSNVEGPGYISELLYGHGGTVLPQYLFIGHPNLP